MKNYLFLATSFLLLMNIGMFAQKAFISQENRTLKTYPFNDPDPVPILTDNAKIYPYFKYEGYSHKAKNQDWKVVKLENDYVEVFVTPEVGGKVWGAIERSTGEEFIYRNEVMKFRNISMRGPWTSGGIEFNFGIIGHHPSTATPVDYVLEEHQDGSVSCTVGNIDLPSRTQWRVTIRLPKDKAAFETDALWYNPTAMNQAYYNWMTGAAPARADFEFFTPGDELLKHSGEALPWPMDDMGRNLALYKENDFGPSKSYHVVGEYNDFFGGYYHDAKYGFGHWGEYEAIPGQKLWLWALSRSGGIWEDLLTDTDGQYIEFQAGRQFLQYFPGGHDNPQKQANFEPYSADTWKEVWFPVKEIGGMSDVSEDAVMNVSTKDGVLTIGLNSFIKTKATLQIYADGKLKHEAALDVEPMVVFSKDINIAGAEKYQVVINELDLNYTSDPNDLLIERPFHTPKVDLNNSTEKLYKSGWEDLKYREFEAAKEKFAQVLKSDPYHIEAMLGMGELLYRQGLYEEGLTFANQALTLDTYHPKANYVAGILYRGKGDYLNAKEALGWAARSMEFRSNAYAQISEILLAEGQFEKAKKYANKALDFNQYNINAYQVLAIIGRETVDGIGAVNALEKIKKIDPINHFVFFENYLWTKKEADLLLYKNANRSEIAYQTYLELAIDYFNKGQKTAAKQVLDAAPQHPIIDLWWSYLQKNKDSKYLKGIGLMSPELVFPFRRETLAALAWANQTSNHWKLKYYYALNLWSKGRKAEAAVILQAIGNSPDYAPFYLARASFLADFKEIDPLPDLNKANQLNAGDWRTSKALIQYHLDEKDISTALKWAKKAYQQFPDNYAIGMDYTEALNLSENYKESINVLNQLKVLPFEGASGGRKLYEKAHYGEALNLIQQKNFSAAVPLLEKAKLWPENLGVGKPYDADERIPNYLLAYCYQQLGEDKKAQDLWEAVANYTQQHLHLANSNQLLGLKALEHTSGSSAAKALLQAFLVSKNGQTPITKWIAARFLGNIDKQKEAEKGLDHDLTFVKKISDL